MNINIAREVAARIWCDPDYSHVTMNPEIAEKIAQMLKLAAIADTMANQLMQPTTKGGG